MKKGVSQKVIKRIEAIERINISDALVLRYVVERRSYRNICLLWKINNRTISKLLKEYNIAIRYGGEAVKTQWENNPKRREEAGKLLAQTNHKLAQEGRHVRQGKTKENSEMIRNIAEKLKTSSSFFRKDVREKARKASMETRKKHPERMSALRKPLTPAKSIVAEHLKEKGFEFETGFLCKFYVADFFIPSLNMIVDCKGRGRFPLSYERHKYLSAENRCVVYCVNEFLLKGNLTNLDEYIVRRKSFGFNPTSVSEETVIFGACSATPFGADGDKFVINRFGVRSNYYSVLTRASND